MMKFIGFITLVLVIVFCAHGLLYISTIRFFSIVDPGVRKAILGAIIFLALSFFPSALFLRLHVNVISQLFYVVAAVWLGLFIYLLMALALSWGFLGLGKLVGLAPNMKVVGLIFFLLAAGVTGYGIWSARNLVVTQIHVTIPGLPEHWRNQTIVQLSDVHLGTINGPGFMRIVADKVNGLDPALILITGDLFDGMGGDLPAFIEPLNRLKATHGVFFVTGNHEGYMGLGRARSILAKTRIITLDNKIADLAGLQVIGISFPEYSRHNGARRLLTQSGSYDSKKPSILLYHTPTDIGEFNTDRATQQSRTYWYPETGMGLAKEMGIDLQLSGHTHKGQFIPFGFLTKSIYAGYDYGYHKDGNFHLYVSSGVGTWGPPLKIGSPAEIVSIQLR